MIKIMRPIAKRLGFYRLVSFMLNQMGAIRPEWRVTRGGISYNLDLRQVIDAGIFAGGWEKQTIQVLRQTLRPGDVVIEVGANVGAHTLIMADLVGNSGKIIAVEPTEFARKKLQDNINLNKRIRNIAVVPDLVSNHDLATPKLDINSSWSVDGKQAPETLRQASVTTIDAIVEAHSLERLDLLKIDVDGYDYKVLQGASQTIIQHRPTIFCELCEYTLNEQGDSIDDIFEMLSEFNYTCVLDADGSALTVERAKGLVGHSTSINGVFKPV